MKRDRALKVASGTMWFAAVTLWLSAMSLYERYFYILPRHRDAASGHTFAFNYHGIVIYLTHAQQSLQLLLMISAGTCVVVAACLSVLSIRGKPHHPLWRGAWPRRPSWLPQGIDQEPPPDDRQALDARRSEFRK